MVITLRSIGRPPVCWLALMIAALLSVVYVPSVSAQGHSTKKGWAGGSNIQGEVNPSNADWYYSWWHNKPTGDANANADWVPLIKFVNGNFQRNLDIVAGYNDVDTLLVLNEPERADQSNVPVQTAINVWPQVQATLPHLKLVSPAVSDTVDGRAWLDAFFAEVDSRNGNADPTDDMRVDSVAFHWYGSDNANNPVGAANAFLNRVDWYHNQYNRPLWIKEFAIHDWDQNETDAQILEANRIFLETVIPELESRSYVEKYAYYSYFSDAQLFDGGNPVTPNSTGDAYVGTLKAGDTFDLDGVDQGTDVFYFRGGALKNDGPALGSALRALDALEDASTIGGQSDFALTGNSFVRVRSGATLTKTGPNQITWQNAEVTVDGNLNIGSGTVYVDGGVLSGAGTTQIAPGATLEMRPPGGRGSYRIAGQAVELAGTLSGNLLISDGTTLTVTNSNALISGSVTVSNATLNAGGDGFNEASIVDAPIATGLQLHFDASQDTAGDATWTNIADAANSLAFGAAATPIPVNAIGLPAISAAYSPAAVGGATGLNNYFEVNGPRSRQDATFEVVFRVDESATGNDQVILETGGAGRGVAFVLNGNQLQFNVDGDGSDLDLFHNLSAGWHQAVGVIDLDAAGDSITLYVNGQEVGSLTGQNIGDWSGGNPLGIGDGADSATGVSSSPGQVFQGEVAIARYYGNTAFALAEVEQNYASLAGQPIATNMHFDSDLSLTGNSEIRLDIAAGGLADKLVVDGQITLINATLSVGKVGDGQLAAGDVYDLLDTPTLNGEFESIVLPMLEAGLMWNIAALTTTGEIAVSIVGDYNGDGSVDAADYTVWRSALNDQVTAFTGADGNGDGLVDASDYQVWIANYGNDIASLSQASALASVPEPVSSSLSFIAMMLGAMFRARSQSRT